MKIEISEKVLQRLAELGFEPIAFRPPKPNEYWLGNNGHEVLCLAGHKPITPGAVRPYPPNIPRLIVRQKWEWPEGLKAAAITKDAPRGAPYKVWQVIPEFHHDHWDSFDSARIIITSWVFDLPPSTGKAFTDIWINPNLENNNA